MVLTLAYFIIALFVLILIHELGHFSVARLCGVKVLRFSFGFGKVLASWRDKKGTQYAFSLIPLGGYVKMLDEEEETVPANERHLAFNNKPLAKRVAIVLAGPVFNFLFAFFALWLVLIIGIHSLAPMITRVQENTPAAIAGLQANDEIISFNHQPITSWHDFQYAIMPYIGSNDTVHLKVKSMNNDSVRDVDLPLADWHLDAKKPDPLASLGVVPFIPAIPPIVNEVLDDSPAALAGIKKGDIIKKINNKSCDDWLDLVEYVRGNPDKSLILTLLRNGEKKEISLKIGRNPKTQEGFLGLRSEKVEWPNKWLRYERVNPIVAIPIAFNQTKELTTATFSLLGRFFIGKIGFQNISGPVGIAQGAGESGRGGLASYLSFLALVSISLGVLNLLPIPMLDGGHLLFYLIEFIIRRPLSDSYKSIGLYIGLLFLSALTVLALTNDISRLG